MPDPRAAGPLGGGSITVEEIKRSDAREAVHVLALSFADEPALSHILGSSPRRRYRVLVPFMWAGLRSYPGSTKSRRMARRSSRRRRLAHATRRLAAPSV